MGVYDEIRCDAPLPDGHNASGVWFQSKSFPDSGMCRYTITREGRLTDALGNDLEPEGYLTFYTNDRADENARGTDRRRRLREYRARFLEGQLQHIVRVVEDEPERRYHGLASFRWFDTPSFMFGDSDEADEGTDDGSA